MEIADADVPTIQSMIPSGLNRFEINVPIRIPTQYFLLNKTKISRTSEILNWTAPNEKYGTMTTVKTT